ncbi:nitrogenase component 1 [Acetonema longum]|uniref:Nitrogenase n=1 Tax=Acetonema longum DSM 6540 TaxID=1009370 RepID=F7NPZ6_9FIRM|nr:nitrogenase component 1 [Acetonema longum]EGO61873.1 Nitrogenase [Acetonema longum DSM 6540]
MTKFIERPRFLCALGGALATLNALPKAVPIIHAAAGCGGNIGNALHGASGYLGGGYCGGLATSSSNVAEKEIVFGGEERLAEQIANTLKIMKGDLYFVVTGCMTEIIGDDALNVTRRFRESGANLLAADTGGFLGNSYRGYEIVLETLFKEFVPAQAVKDTQTVNLWGVVPVQDVFWKGNLAAVKQLLHQLGLKVNTFFGEGETLENLRNAGKAALNIVLSDSWGVQPAKVFSEIHNTPYLTTPLPIGPTATAAFLREVAQTLGLTAKTANQVVSQEQARFYDYFTRLADGYNDLDFQRYAVIVADSNYASSLTAFLGNDLGWLPEVVVITDGMEEEKQGPVLERFNRLRKEIRPLVAFDTDTASVAKYLAKRWPPNRGRRYYDSFSPAFVLGSLFDKDLADDLGASHLSISYPISNRVVLDRAYAGCSGALRLAEDLLSQLVGTR